MDKSIWKFELKLTDLQSIAMPEGAEILSVQLQVVRDGDYICLWAMVNPELPSVVRDIEIVRTGDLFQECPRRFIGTVQKGEFVCHVFERLFQ